MSVQYDVTKENWWLSVGQGVIGDTHRSLTNKLLRDCWLTCNAIEQAKVNTFMHGEEWTPVTVRIVKNGVPQSEGII